MGRSMLAPAQQARVAEDLCMLLWDRAVVAQEVSWCYQQGHRRHRVGVESQWSVAMGRPRRVGPCCSALQTQVPEV